jgi:hypothetical protein
MNNGHLELLTAAFPEYPFRCFSKAKPKFHPLQCARSIVEDIALPPNEQRASLAFPGRVQRFHLKAFASDAATLGDKLRPSNAEVAA